MKTLREYRDKAIGFADLVHYAAMVADGVVLNKDGSFMAGWRYRGPDMVASSNAELESMSAQVNALLNRMGSGWMVQVDMVRRPLAGYPEGGFFPDGTTLLIESERRLHHLEEGARFGSEYVITLTYNPPSEAESRLAGMMVEQGQETQTDTIIEQFERQAQEFHHSLLSIFGQFVERLSADTSQDHFLSYLHYCMTGLTQPITLPPVPMYLDNLIGGQDFTGGMEPKIGEHHIGVVSIDGFPMHSYPGILSTLNNLPCSYRWSSRFIFLEAEEAKSLINRTRKKWKQKIRGLKDQLMETATGPVNYDALAMAEDAEGAMADSASGQVRFGHYTSVIVLMEADKAALKASCDALIKVIRGAGFSARIETINAVEAFLGSLPGHGFYNIRKTLLHSLNLADMLPLTAIWQGQQVNPCPFYPEASPPLITAATTGTTPFYLSLHSGDVGHTAIIGPTGAGKSVLLGLIAAQHFRYEGAQVFFFDKGYSAFPLCMAAGGDHYEPASDESGLYFAPLSQIDKESERLWAAEWVELLLSLQNITVTPGQRSAITEALLLLSQSDSRTLTELVGKIQDKTLREALRPYTLQGMGRLLDEKQDGLRTGRFQVFEMEHLMGKGPHYVQPVLSYLFHKIEQRLDGSPTLIILDEAWIALENPLFQAKIREWLKVLRKANAAVIFATQSLSDIGNSPIRDSIYESCLTRILLPNPEAALDNIRPHYEKLGLGDAEIALIAGAEKKRYYYFTSPEGKRLFELGLGPVALSFLASSGKEELRQIRQSIAEHGESWPAHWLEARGLPEWAGYWREIAA